MIAVRRARLAVLVAMALAWTIAFTSMAQAQTVESQTYGEVPHLLLVTIDLQPVTNLPTLDFSQSPIEADVGEVTVETNATWQVLFGSTSPTRKHMELRKVSTDPAVNQSGTISPWACLDPVTGVKSYHSGSFGSMCGGNPTHMVTLTHPLLYRLNGDYIAGGADAVVSGGATGPQTLTARVSQAIEFDDWPTTIPWAGEQVRYHLATRIVVSGA